MKKQNFFLIVALLFACNTIFAQTPGGYPVELKPWNPGTPPGIIEKPDTTKPNVGEGPITRENIDTGNPTSTYPDFNYNTCMLTYEFN